ILNLTSLKADSYRLIVRKAGYREDQRTINVVAGQSNLIAISLEPMAASPMPATPEPKVRPAEPVSTPVTHAPVSSEAMLATIEQDFLSGNYPRVISTCLTFLKS